MTFTVKPKTKTIIDVIALCIHVFGLGVVAGVTIAKGGAFDYKTLICAIIFSLGIVFTLLSFLNIKVRVDIFATREELIEAAKNLKPKP